MDRSFSHYSLPKYGAPILPTGAPFVMQVVSKRVSELIPYANNPRKNDKAVEAVANSISEFGFKVPLVIDKNNVIVCGHTRLKAAEKLGLDEVPCVIADDLTEEQIKAFRLADNKVSEASDWDWDKLNEELDGLTIDMEAFGFEFEDLSDIPDYGEKTQDRVSNILNLGLASFEGVGPYDIPQLDPVTNLPKITEWIGFNYVLSDKEPEGKAVHFFVDDYQFERIWNNPDQYVEKLRKYACVATPDFSPYGDMPMATQIYNHYRKHWVGRYLQDSGVTVIPTIRASTDERSLKWYLDGEPKNGVVLISSMWANQYHEEFLKEFKTMQKTLNPSKILVYGRPVEGISGEIEYIKSFTDKRWNHA